MQHVVRYLDEIDRACATASKDLAASREMYQAEALGLAQARLSILIAHVSSFVRLARVECEIRERARELAQ